jgi:hypothetical protein
MTTCALLLMVIAIQPKATPNVNQVVAAWTELASSAESADAELNITRDSRHESFGAPQVDRESPKVRLRFDRERRQLDVSRLTVTRRDGRTQPAESDPDRARIEFRNVLIEEELKGPQMIPVSEPATLIIDEKGTEKGQKLCLLDRLLAEAPLRAVQPLRFIDPAKLERLASDSIATRFIAKQSADRTLEVDTELPHPFRPLRITQYEAERPVWQIDLTWGGLGSFPSNYFIQTINGSGEALEFVEASLGRAETPLPSSTEFGQIGATRDQPPPPNSASIRWRARVRAALDSLWLPLAAIVVWGLVIVARSRRRPAVS